MPAVSTWKTWHLPGERYLSECIDLMMDDGLMSLMWRNLTGMHGVLTSNLFRKPLGGVIMLVLIQCQ